MFDESDERRAGECPGVKYAKVLRGGDVLRVVYEHRASTEVVEEVEDTLNLEPGQIASTQEYNVSAEYRGRRD
jgi:hypothetical protein